MKILFIIAIIVTTIGLIASALTVGVIISDRSRNKEWEKKLP